MSIRPAVAGLIGCLLLPLAAAAQQPPRPTARLVATTRSEAAKPAFENALVEVANYGWTRADQQLLGLLKAEPEAGLIRALHAATSLNFTLAQRRTELDRAVEQAATATTPELVLVLALREWRAGRTAAANTLLESAQKLLPDEPLVRWLQTSLASDPETQLRLAEAAHTAFPDYPAIHNHLAYAQYRGGFRKEALETVRQYAELLPNHPNAHDSYGELLLLEGEVDAAHREFGRALELDPSWYYAHWGMASVAMFRGDMRTARTEAEAAVALAPEPIERITALRYAGAAAALTKDLAAARRYFAQVIDAAEAAQMPAAARSARAQLAVVEAALGRGDEARATLGAALETPGDKTWDGTWRLMVGAILKDDALMKQGLADQESLAAAAPANASRAEALHLARSIHAAGTGDVALARTELAQVTNPAWRVLAHGHIARALRTTDRAGAAQAREGFRDYVRFDMNGTYPFLITL